MLPAVPADGPDPTEQVKRIVGAMSGLCLEGCRSRVLRIGTVAFAACVPRAMPGARAALGAALARSGHVAAAADARVDNREEVANALGLRRWDEAGDAGLILAAYLKWGDAFAERLAGDFAAAIWDGRTARLLCVRDHGGVRPLFYHAGADGAFCCASALRGVLALKGLPRQLDEAQVFDFLIGRPGGTEQTFYQGIKRLPPAHLLVVSAARAERRRYWSLDLNLTLRLTCDGAYAEAFRAVFDRAVATRLKGPGKLGLMLSGGLDSSCIARTAVRLTDTPLQTLSLIYDDFPACDERPYIAAVLDGTSLRPHYLKADSFSPLGARAEIAGSHDEPQYGYGMFLAHPLYAHFAALGVSNVLSGFDGDTSISHGLERLADLTRRGEVPRALGELRTVARRMGQPPWGLARRRLLGPLVPDSLRAVLRRARGQDVHSGGPLELLRADFARRANASRGAPESWDVPARPRNVTCARWAHWKRLSAASRVRVFEVSGLGAARHGISLRYPFEDRALQQFCLSLPADQQCRGGWTRYIARAALGARLPAQIARRMAKPDTSVIFVRRLLQADLPKLRALFGEEGAVLVDYVDLDALRRLYTRCMVAPSVSSSAMLYRVATLAYWLNTRGRPAEPGLEVTHESD